MAFYYESEDLNLRKKYNNLQYDEIEEEDKQNLAYSISEQEMTNKQHEEQLQLDFEIIMKDIKNMCVYFTQKFIVQNENNPQLQKFPFIKVKNRVCHIFEKYQEQNTLLDSILEQICVSFMDVVKVYVLKNVNNVGVSSCEEFHNICDTIYILTKVRGIRTISRYCPHEVCNLEPVVMYLQHCSTDLNQNWETKYVILMWLSIIVLVPFDLNSIDSQIFNAIQDTFTSSNTIITSLLNLGVNYLKSSTKLRNMGALYLSKLFSRTDILKCNLLEQFLNWSVKQIHELQDNILNTFYITGILETLVEILKVVQRDVLKNNLYILLPLLNLKQQGTLINLFLTKLTQRIGLVYLRPRVVSWTYKKGTTNLQQTLTIIDYSRIVTNSQISKTNQQLQQQQQSNIQLEDVDYFIDVDQEGLETVVDTLLQQIINKDTVVRWSAAKGIGRICARLNLDQADDIFDSLINTCFTPINGDTAWHGGCLALGELCRRGLILENKLESIIPIICKALIFEQNQGGYSIGVNVRDSACFIAWSAARAYDPEILKNHVLALAQHLVIVMIFDREVNVRRAASSTFQELVGRCPNIIPHGISILTEADYFSLAMIHNAYLRIAPFVASYPEYFKQMVDHLAFIKIASQDKEVRKLAAKSLGRLLVLNPTYFKENLIYESILKMVKLQSLNSKHGALFALGDLLIAQSGNITKNSEEKELKDSVFLRTLTKNERQLAKAGEHITIFKSQYEQLLQAENMNLLSEEIIDEIMQIPKILEDSLKGKSGEQIRIAAYRLIECISISKLPLQIDQHAYYLKFIEDGLKNPLEEIQISAAKALRLLSNQYQTQGQYLIDGKEFLKRVIKQLHQKSTTVQVLIQGGYAQSVGSFSPQVLHNEDLSILYTIGLSKKRAKLTSWSIDPDTRKFAIKSLGQSIINQLNNNYNCEAQLLPVIDCILYAMLDYTVNKKGDVGLFIRENSIIAIQSILVCYVGYIERNHIGNIIINEQCIIKIIGQLLQQLCEKIDRVRLLAGSVLQDLFKSVFPKLQRFENYEQISTIFSTANLQETIIKDQERVDQTFQSEIIEAEIKNLKDVLQTIGKTDLIYHWNLPHCCYRLIVPILAYPTFCRYILTGLCISVGGISESIQKFSEEALMQYIHLNQNLDLLMTNLIEILKLYALDERVVIPLFKTASLVLQKEEIQSLPIIKQQTEILFQLIYKETHKTQSINKLSASVQLIIDILSVNPELFHHIIQHIFEILTSDLPKVRKQLAEAFYLYLLSHDNEELISTDNNCLLQDYLLETDWLSEELDKNIEECRSQLKQLLSL
ncbi:unnamed protein product (macronuclear) [Paramecium tetraurelia]|uniref:Uncharacterized protein n=1 Tax=Paramecium tetraurelia TaxID=5888 RepID=A0C4J1_PARTE|nr:uncharacterized protein GSPATT00035188001 [Paramecium tetraurelia]CAK65708.1 unnamed protein product [Paramecium tetraurelia]|eukprot:XP_001433105.1 hypothetical protein (macronuclear) [Paramecium tetraurelia strain d4-2]